MYLASDTEGRTITIAEIADEFGVSKAYLMKVIARLTSLGWVTSARGRNGGIRLDDGTLKLKLGSMMLTLEQNGPIIDCRALDCRLTGRCTFKHALEEARQDFYSSLDRYRLGDLNVPPLSTTLHRMHRHYLSTKPT